MEVVYYFDKDLNICPVKKYLERFISSESEKSKESDRKNRILATIDEKIQFIKENPNSRAAFLSPLHTHNFVEIKSRKDKNIVIRILYFFYDHKMILLNAFEKPDNYDTNKIKKEIEKHYIKTDSFIIKFKNTPTYEKYK
ncbi:MAG: hypothetical protein V1716_04660 [Candidatus Uhrbacteria bacterium]